VRPPVLRLGRRDSQDAESFRIRETLQESRHALNGLDETGLHRQGAYHLEASFHQGGPDQVRRYRGIVHPELRMLREPLLMGRIVQRP